MEHHWVASAARAPFAVNASSDQYEPYLPQDPGPRPREPPLVLLVDDVTDNREMYAEYFAFKGYAVLSAGTGTEGIAVARSQSPDVILLDLQMPGLNGYETLQLLRREPVCAHVPIIALTAHAFDNDRAEALALGFDAFVGKPCLPNDLATIVEGLLRDRRGLDP